MAEVLIFIVSVFGLSAKVTAETNKKINKKMFFFMVIYFKYTDFQPVNDNDRLEACPTFLQI